MVVLGEIRQGLDCSETCPEELRVRAKRECSAPDPVTGFGREGGKQSPVGGCDPCARDWGLLRSCSPPTAVPVTPCSAETNPELPSHSFVIHFN